MIQRHWSQHTRDCTFTERSRESDIKIFLSFRFPDIIMTGWLITKQEVYEISYRDLTDKLDASSQLQHRVYQNIQ